MIFMKPFVLLFHGVVNYAMLDKAKWGDRRRVDEQLRADVSRTLCCSFVA